jgi:hypothetical protein
MGNPRIVIDPTCDTGYFDKPNTICVSLYRAAVLETDGKTVKTPAKSFHRCWEGGAQVSGEALAKQIIAAVLHETGIEGKIVPPIGHDPKKKTNPKPKTLPGGRVQPAPPGVPEYAPSETGDAKTAIVEFTNVDLYDYYFTVMNYSGRAGDGGSGRVEPDGSKWKGPGGSSQPPAGWPTSPKQPGPDLGGPTENPGPLLGPENVAIIEPRSAPPADASKSGVMAPSSYGVVIPIEPIDSSSTQARSAPTGLRSTLSAWVSVLSIRPTSVKPAGILRVDVLGPRGGADGFWSTTLDLRTVASAEEAALRLAEEFSIGGFLATVQSNFLLFTRLDGSVPPFFWISYKPDHSYDGLYVIAGDLPAGALHRLRSGGTSFAFDEHRHDAATQAHSTPSSPFSMHDRISRETHAGRPNAALMSAESVARGLSTSFQTLTRHLSKGHSAIPMPTSVPASTADSSAERARFERPGGSVPPSIRPLEE